MNAALQLDLLKGKRQRGVRPPDASEFAIQCMVVDSFWRWRKPEWWLWHIPSGEYRSPATAAKLARMGARPGLPDLLLIDPVGKHYWLELKSRLGIPSPAQTAFFMLIAHSQTPHAIVRSYKEAVDQLRAWGAVRASVSA